MIIITVNIPESYILGMKKLVGGEKNYPSRSELVRAAVRAFLVKEIALAKQKGIWQVNSPEEEFDDKNYVRIPIEKQEENDEEITEFKTYKILREG